MKLRTASDTRYPISGTIHNACHRGTNGPDALSLISR